MKSNQNLIQPKTFTSGVQYLCLEYPSNSGPLTQPVMIPVYFENYDVCPAYIIVRNGSGKHWRCPRDQLFINEDPK